MLISFDTCINFIADLGDGLTQRIHGDAHISSLIDHIVASYEDSEVNWFKLRESFLFIISVIAYIIAYVGVLVANVLVHFAWSILYVCSPLMILMYVSKKTAFVTTSLYKGLLNVICWKVVWALLAMILLKFATSPEVGNVEALLTTIIINLCIGVSMLFIPLTVKSLTSNGLSSLSTSLALAPALLTYQGIKGALSQRGKNLLQGAGHHAKGGASHFVASPVKNSLRRARSAFMSQSSEGGESRGGGDGQQGAGGSGGVRGSPFKRWGRGRNIPIGSHSKDKEPFENNVLYPDFRGKKKRDEDD